jgi:tetratricopeptide (TPR) repeat protein
LGTKVAKKTLAEHLQQASLLFGVGEVVKAGQIWQAILKVHPLNNEAKAGLLKVRDILSKVPADSPEGPIDPESQRKLGTPRLSLESKLRMSLTVPEVSATNGQSLAHPDAELLMKQGRAHYDQGSLHEALEAWEKALEMDPNNNLALSYARGVRKELGLPVSEAPRGPQDPPSPLSPSKNKLGELAGHAPWTPVSEKTGQHPNTDPNGSETAQGAKHQDGATNGTTGNNWQLEDIASQIERGSQLYKNGKIAEAITAWESALSMDPGNALTKGYLAMAREDLVDKRQSTSDGTSPKKHEALTEYAPFGLGRLNGAAHCASAAGLADSSDAVPPSNSLSSAVGVHNLETAADIHGKVRIDGGHGAHDLRQVSRPVGPSRESAPAKMPTVILEKQAQNRQGPGLPKKLHGVPFLSRLFRPMAIKVASLLIFISAGAATWIAWAKRDAILRATKAAIVGDAIKTANQSIKAADLGQSKDELKLEVKSALSSDPLRAYMLVKELISRDPNDTSPAKMLEQAKQAMAAAPKVRTDGDLGRFLSAGAFDDAEALLKSTLMQNPNNMRVRENLARVCLMHAKHLIANGQWGNAHSKLLMGAALYPMDFSWQARIKFLENIQSYSKEDYIRWAEMLG